MRTVTAKALIYGAATCGGMDPSEHLPDNIARALVEYLNGAIRTGWESYDWPELTKIEQRAYRDPYEAGTTYGLGDEVWDAATLTYYRSLAAGNAGNPLTDTTKWETPTDFDRYVSWEQTGQTPIGDILGASRNDPRKTGLERALAVGYWLGENGIQFGPDAPNLVWIRFRTRPATITWDQYAATTSYAAGETAYYPADGQCYTCIAAATNRTPPTSPTYWQPVELPYVLAEWAKRAAAADWLREERQYEKAAAQQAHAQTALDREWDKLSRHAGLGRRYRAITA